MLHEKNLNRNPSRVRKFPTEYTLDATERPSPIVEVDVPWGNQFLESPASIDPPAFIYTISELCAGMEVGEVHVAHGSILIPLKHGVDALRQLRAAALVNATSVDPGVLNIHLESKAAGFCDLGVSALRRKIRGSHILKGDFISLPGV